ncbi:hypothetical protein M422DRAFT_243462 [Sphaerobolus stellatus SS14]|nr:hypothetical protein M422DRAFT_243462 [Sphaerobolus stellatus SS14]
MSNIPNERDIPPNAPRIRPFYCRTSARRLRQPGCNKNGMPTPGGRAIPRNALVVPRQVTAGTTRPPNAPRMRPIPLPDV